MRVKFGRKTLGVICIIAAIAIILSSAVLGPNAQYSLPYIPESVYFSNLNEYAGKEVYITASIAGINGNSIAFENNAGEKIAAELQNPEEAEKGGLVFLSINYNAQSDSFSGKILYRYEDKALREFISIIGLIVLIVYLGRVAKFDLRRLKLVVGGRKNA